MRIIAHRGLLNGPNSVLENKSKTIETAIAHGFEVEIDVWFHDGEWYLGHDKPTEKVLFSFLSQQCFWIHCKNLAALERMGAYKHLNSFWHETDSYTLTSHNYIWTYPGKELSSHSVCVMPEKYIPLEQVRNLKCLGVCTDYPTVVAKLIHG